jgi:DNA sulfur modification protein DndE
MYLYVKKKTNQAMKKLLIASSLLTLFAFQPEERPTLFLCGDSTMANKAPIDAPETGWGMVLPDYFTEAIRIENHAVNGRSTKSFRTLGHWKGVIDKVKSGDYVVLQFGHNDAKESDSLRYAAPQTDYRQNLTRFIAEIREKGANPILMTPVMRRKFDANGQFVDQHGDYPVVVRDLAQKLIVPIIDMHRSSQKTIEKQGVEGSKRLFMHYQGGIFAKHPKGIEDNTHFTRYGAASMAGLFCDGLIAMGHPLRSFLKKSVFNDKYLHELPQIYQPFFRKDSFDITRYGAKDNGITLNTAAIQQAIQMAYEVGGGVVVIPRGLWLTGPIVLKSNVNLHLEQGALLQFTKDYEQYAIVRTNWEGSDAYRVQPPIWAVDASNIAVTGKGVIDGAGESWRMLKKEKVTEADWKKWLASGGVLTEDKQMWYPTERALKGSTMKRPGVIAEGYDSTKAAAIKEFLRPNLIVLTRCQNVLLENVTFQNAPAWTIHPLMCEHLTVRNVIARAPHFAQNGDGMDVESCKNFLIEGCSFDVGDDGITIKSGRDAEGRKRNFPTENGIIRNNIVYRAHGGFVIGSEMSSGVRNLFVTNCTFMGTDIGLRFKTTRGRGGVVENIYCSDISMTNILGEAILFDMYYNGKDFAESESNPKIETKPVSEETPVFKNFLIQNISCIGASRGIVIRGLPEMNVQNIAIENSAIEAKKGIYCIEGDNIRFKNIRFSVTEDATLAMISNSKNLIFDKIEFSNNIKTILNVNGVKSDNLRLLNTATGQNVFGEGVNKKAIKVQ